MSKLLSIAGCLVILGGSAAFAQSSTMSNGAKSSPNTGTQGAAGAAPTPDVGQTTPNVAETPTGKTTSSSMMQQKNKQDSATGASSSGYNTKKP